MSERPPVTRPRDLGFRLGTHEAGPLDALTDVAGVRVGHRTLIEGDGPLVVGSGPVRTGVTVVVPPLPAFAGCHRLNGNGEMTGLEWLRESGTLTSPVAITNTHSVGVVRDALVALERRSAATMGDWALPVVAETYDGALNDIDGFHVRAEHLREAYEAAASGPVAEGAVGGGTGMVCHGFKGGIGTASRVPAGEPAGGAGGAGGAYTVGVLVQANHGARSRFAVNGAPVGLAIGTGEVPRPRPPERDAPPPGSGSIIVVVATDAPLLPHQCDRLAQRAALGIARTGGAGEHTSGDLVLAFATGNELPGATPVADLRMLHDDLLTPLFHATVEATEAAIVHALLNAETTTGRDGVTAYALPPDRLLAVLDRHGLRDLTALPT